MNVWIQILGSSGLAAIIVVVVNAVANRRNLGAQTARTDAETDQIITDTARGLVADLRSELSGKTRELEDVKKRLTTVERERANDRTEISGLQRQVSGVIEDRDALVAYVVVFREWVAKGARPPAPAVPLHLADVLPQWVPGDGAEPPRP